MKAWLFQGQGSQRKGMGAALFARFPALRDEAAGILGYDLARLCQDDPEQALNQTRYTQPAIYVVSWLGYLAAREDGVEARFAAGHSVGEYAALTAAGVMDFALGLRIVAERARLMAEVRGGGLLALLGQDQEQVTALLAELPESGLAIANINSPRQIIVGGAQAPLAQLADLCAARSLRALPLKVSGPFHTPHMAAAEAAFGEFLQGLAARFAAPRFPVIANLDAQPHNREGLVERLSRHLSQPVRWQQVVQRLLTEGVEDFIEIGQPAILGGMLKDIRALAPAPQPQPQPQAVERPLLVQAIAPRQGAEALLGELARHGVMGLLDGHGLDDPELERTLDRYNANPHLRGRFGVSLGGAARLARVAEQGVRCIEIAAHDLNAGLRQRWPQVHWLVRLERHEDLDNGLAHADALLIAADRHMPLLLEALARRERQARQPLIGAGGLAASPAGVQALLDLGVDFVAPGALFLLASEAALPLDVQQRLARMGRQDHRLLSDWRYPELHSRSPGYVLDQAAQAASEAQQALYLGDSIDAAARRDLHNRMQAGLARTQVHGDASLWLFNHWRRQHAADLPIPLPAAQLLELLSPAARPRRTP
ncbi:acyltransferase domain-containing protein [Pseudomonas japonica]|uniref:[acyl-carrier-protein] S-malonyltransferase n=1 Tax=Pseudomonas japonica TaxID=256466 RepID=A0A239F1V5_9PSED|nr:acyltransferase domain-containing protein [Pseudomonas japonica]SNS50122.1 malonyl CoA-acyl carrier protein transacylase [Pseudomonas japonica]